MSNQGNVVFIPSLNSNFPTLTFRTSRWSGGGMDIWVRDLLAKACDPRYKSEYQERDFLYSLCHNGSIEFPISQIGNEDVPTIVVSFDSRTVAFVGFTWGKSPETLLILPFDKFLTEPNPLRERYE